MSRLNKDILFLIFKELQDDSKSLFSCLMVNKLWCETVIPILWRNPWSYNINYDDKNYLFMIIVFYLTNDTKELLMRQGIQLPSIPYQSLLFDYLSYCRSININIINSIISIGSSFDYDQFILQQEFYNLFMKKFPKLKYLDMESINHQLFYFPEAELRLVSLCELRCDTSIDTSYFYGLARLCKYIQRLVIINVDMNANLNGIAKLIEVQKNLKHFKWADEFVDYPLIKDSQKIIFHELEKKANNLNSLEVFFHYEHKFIQEILTKFHKLKILRIENYLFFNEEQLKKLNMQVFHQLEILNIEHNKINVISNIIENSGERLKKILFRPRDSLNYEFDDLNENSLNFIRKIYENCPLIEYLSITFCPSKEHFTEFEKLLKVCKKLKSLLIIIFNNSMAETHKKKMENGEELLNVLIKSTPTNLREIRFFDHFKFSLEVLEEFLGKWRGCALTIVTKDSIYRGEDYKKVINKYKNYGVIKDFRCETYEYNVNYLSYLM
ncbi:hypothetical protein RclHR1_11510005 [Rhizophagus clarus]|uniref:F-box domain-containing protein n=1 Tax=Rhizophagus clarus TaxID=94130 RepID=A0A2Z6QJL7_9GLOM|nr:hypothetical protein RclHR1_11510005 [Rhizophagus clarus]GES83994.1 hypothetical protein GLOIN_2v1764020 [Rhizophagus clarus]